MTKRKTAPPPDSHRRSLTDKEAQKIVDEFLSLKVCELLSEVNSQDTLAERLAPKGDKGSDGVLRFFDAMNLLTDVLTQSRGGSWVRMSLDALEARRDLLCELKRFLDSPRTCRCVNRAAELSLLPIRQPALFPYLDDPAPDVQVIAKSLRALDFTDAFQAIECHARRVDPFDRQGRLARLAAPLREWRTPEQVKEQDLLLENLEKSRPRSPADHTIELAENAKRELEKALARVGMAAKNSPPSVFDIEACNRAHKLGEAAQGAIDAAIAVLKAQAWEDAVKLVGTAAGANQASKEALEKARTAEGDACSPEVLNACNCVQNLGEAIHRAVDATIVPYRLAELTNQEWEEALEKVRMAAGNSRLGTMDVEASNSVFPLGDAVHRAVDAAKAVLMARTWEDEAELAGTAADANRALKAALDKARRAGSNARSPEVREACNSVYDVGETAQSWIGTMIAYSAQTRESVAKLTSAEESPAWTHPRAGDRNPAAAFMLAAEAIVSKALEFPPEAPRKGIRDKIEEFVVARWEQFGLGNAMDKLNLLQSDRSELKKELVAFAKSQEKRLAKTGIPELHALLSEYRETFPVLKECTGGDGVWVATPEFQRFLDEEPPGRSWAEFKDSIDEEPEHESPKK